MPACLQLTDNNQEVTVCHACLKLNPTTLQLVVANRRNPQQPTAMNARVPAFAEEVCAAPAAEVESCTDITALQKQAAEAWAATAAAATAAAAAEGTGDKRRAAEEAAHAAAVAVKATLAERRAKHATRHKGGHPGGGGSSTRPALEPSTAHGLSRAPLGPSAALQLSAAQAPPPHPRQVAGPQRLHVRLGSLARPPAIIKSGLPGAVARLTPLVAATVQPPVMEAHQQPAAAAPASGQQEQQAAQEQPAQLAQERSHLAQVSTATWRGCGGALGAGFVMVAQGAGTVPAP